MGKLSRILLELISFDGPRAIVINLSIIILILLVVPFNGLHYLPIRSVYAEVLPIIFDNECPATGFFANCEVYSMGQTRAMSNLLHGDIEQALNHNPLVIILFMTMLIVLIFNIYKIIQKSKKNKKI